MISINGDAPINKSWQPDSIYFIAKRSFRSISYLVVALSLLGSPSSQAKAEKRILQITVKEARYCDNSNKINAVEKTFDAPFGVDGRFEGTYKIESQLLTIKGQVLPLQAEEQQVKVNLMLDYGNHGSTYRSETSVALAPGKATKVAGFNSNTISDNKTCNKSMAFEITRLKNI